MCHGVGIGPSPGGRGSPKTRLPIFLYSSMQSWTVMRNLDIIILISLDQVSICYPTEKENRLPSSTCSPSIREIMARQVPFIIIQAVNWTGSDLPVYLKRRIFTRGKARFRKQAFTICFDTYIQFPFDSGDPFHKLPHHEQTSISSDPSTVYQISVYTKVDLKSN